MRVVFRAISGAAQTTDDKGRTIAYQAFPLGGGDIQVDYQLSNDFPPVGGSVVFSAGNTLVKEGDDIFELRR
ncbi:hypothetical protein J1TS1_28230 [Shouchella clausii]|uniref:hypothetical protein n=1 Tax=Shouchella clausii TaxID=79880 RepID=UPI001AFDDD8F|nr:hypothetical protein [Shouchella clausii]GIN08678.1 hypothetical protein J1TS1_28230 [Shouchella clausii]